MGMTLLRMRTAALAALAWGTACGGNVVVDGMPDGSGGAGATSSSANTTGAFGSSAISTGVGAAGAVTVGVGGSTAVGTGVGGSTAVGTGVGGSSAVSTGVGGVTTAATGSTSTGVGGGDPWSRCMGFCERYAECGEIEPGQCELTCKSLLSDAPQCNEQLAMFFDCTTNGSFDCNLVFERCQPFLDRYYQCQGQGAGDCTELECFEEGRERTCSCKGSCPNTAFSVECRPERRDTITCSCFVNGELRSTCQDVGPACGLAHRCCGPLFDELR